MVDIAAFQAVRYAPGIDLADVSAPPYDAIDAELSTVLHARSPANVVRLERSAPHVGDSRGADRYARAAEAYAAWLVEGVLVRDAVESVTVYEQRVTYRGAEHVQRGVLAALALRPWDAREVLPHERIFRGPVEDRLRLLRSLPVNTSPVFVLGQPGAAAPELLADVADRTPDRVFTDRDESVTHRLWRLTDAVSIEALRGAWRGVTTVMADGHHRYTTALEHAATDQHPGADRILAFVASSDATTGPLVRPMHRLVRDAPPALRSRLQEAGVALEAVDPSADVVQDLVDTRTPPRFGLLTGDGAWVASISEGSGIDALLADRHPVVRRLAVTALQALLHGALGVHDDPDALVYTPDLHAAERAVADGRADALFVLPHLSVDDVRRVAEVDERLPPKSTSFFPKPRTGLVLRPLTPDPPRPVG